MSTKDEQEGSDHDGEEEPSVASPPKKVAKKMKLEAEDKEDDEIESKQEEKIYAMEAPPRRSPAMKTSPVASSHSHSYFQSVPGSGYPGGYYDRRPYHYHPYERPSLKSPPTVVTTTASRGRAAGSRSHQQFYPSPPASSCSSVVPPAARRRSSTGSTRSSTSRSGTPTSTPGGKAQRGLRHFSVMVCKHVEEKKTTTYNEVADELVRQVVAERSPEEAKKAGKFDEKNIRRRVYDALNVLLAMGIIYKDKKEIIWKGLPRLDSAATNLKRPAEDDEPVVYSDADEYDAEELEAMHRERAYLQAEVNRKREALRDILTQQVCFHNLVMRNQQWEAHASPPEDEKIPLPFIICNTKPMAALQCDMNKEKTNVMFEFDSPFEINDDNTILKRMKMDKTSVQALQDMLPEDMFDYCHSEGILEPVLLPGEDPARAPRRFFYNEYESRGQLPPYHYHQHHHQPY